MKKIKIDIGVFDYCLNYLEIEDFYLGRKKVVEIQWVVGEETVNVDWRNW